MKALLFVSIIASAWVAAIPVAANSSHADSAEGDLKGLQGRWTTKAGPNRDIAVELQIDEHKARFKIKTAKGLKFQVRGEVRIDEKAMPRALDWIKFNGLDQQEIPDILAIYELDGDKLKVCNGGPNNDRPTEFKAGDGVLADVLVFERSKPEKASRGGKD